MSIKMKNQNVKAQLVMKVSYEDRVSQHRIGCFAISLLTYANNTIFSSYHGQGKYAQFHGLFDYLLHENDQGSKKRI